MVKYLLDSSVIIEALRTQKVAAEVFLTERYEGEICLSQITVAELFSGQSAQDKEVATYLRYLIVNFQLVGLDTEISVLAGQLRCVYQMAMPDALIAATALANHLVVVTHNTKDFRKIPGLKTSRPL